MLVTLKEILEPAKENKYAVGAFNTPNLETLQGVLQAAEESQSPVIIAHAESHESLISLDVIGPVMIDLAKKATVPVCVHLDHGATFDMCVKAMKLGFTSVMFDGSAKSFEENVNETKEIVKVAHALGVSVEAELGHIFTSEIGGGEGKGPRGAEDFDSLEDVYTNPESAREFVEKTGIDALAIAFGTTHGLYLKEPELDLERITEIKQEVDLPFVMHGASGLSTDEYLGAINNGITKINYFTYMSIAGGEAAAKYVREASKNQSKIFFHELSLEAAEGIKKEVLKAMNIFSNRTAASKN